MRISDKELADLLAIADAGRHEVCHCGEYVEDHDGRADHGPVEVDTPESEAMRQASVDNFDDLVRDLVETRKQLADLRRFCAPILGIEFGSVDYD